MQWWGNFGSAVGGLLAGISALVVIVTVARRGPEFLRARTNAANELATTQQAARRQGLEGWSSAGINTWGVALITSETEQELALKALRNGGQTDYVVLRVSGGPRQAAAFERLLLDDPHIARRPTLGECEALKIGLEAMDIPLAATEIR